MKKLVLSASLLIAFAAGAQKRGEDFRPAPIENQRDQRGFRKSLINPDQQRQIAALSRQRLSERDYDAQLRRILNREQYLDYMAYQHKDWKKDRDFAMNGPRR